MGAALSQPRLLLRQRARHAYRVGCAERLRYGAPRAALTWAASSCHAMDCSKPRCRGHSSMPLSWACRGSGGSTCSPSREYEHTAPCPPAGAGGNSEMSRWRLRPGCRKWPILNVNTFKAQDLQGLSQNAMAQLQALKGTSKSHRQTPTASRAASPWPLQSCFVDT